jgi:methionyl-tRNA formyltransferase
MKIVFIGTVLFSYKSLEKLINLKAEIVGVITQKTSSFNSDFYDLTPLCTQHNIPINYTQDINADDTLLWIKDKQPDIIFCFGWSSLIKKSLLELPSMGIVGFHPAKLPQNRGRHPLIWAIVLGLTESASTFFFMDEGADSGDILSQETFAILKNDTAHSLYEKMTQIALKQIETFLVKLQNNSYQRVPQNHQEANYWRKRGFRDGIIDFRMSKKAIYNLVRALSKPYIGASLIYKKEIIHIWKVEEITLSDNTIESGKVLDIQDNMLYIKCYDGIIKIIEHNFTTLPKIGEYL